MVTYLPREFFVNENPCTNVVISLFTTSSARLKLLNAMETVAYTKDCELLYTDTYIYIAIGLEGNFEIKRFFDLRVF